MSVVIVGLLTAGALTASPAAVAETPPPTPAATVDPAAETEAEPEADTSTGGEEPSAMPTEAPSPTEVAEPPETPIPTQSPAPMETPAETDTPAATATPTPEARGPPETVDPDVDPGTAADAPDAARVPEPAPSDAALMRTESFSALAAGVPQDPSQVWDETFEQNQSATPTSIAAYPTSASPRYGADALWRDAPNCTGVLTDYDAVFPAGNTFCSTLLGLLTGPQRQARRMADVLGQVQVGVVGGASTPVNGSTAATRSNHALTATTNAPLPTTTVNLPVLESNAGLGIVASAARYYTLDLVMAGDECSSNPAQLDASLINSATVRPLTVSAPLSACALSGGLYTSPTIATTNPLEPALSTSVKAGRLTADTAALLTAAEASATRIRLTNRVSTSVGNVFAVDDLRLRDSTPRLDAAFSPTSVPQGTASTVTFTVTNTSELAAKADWSFTETLPSGLVVAATPSIGGTCVNATGTAFAVTAAAGGSQVAAVGGDLATGATSCTMTVNVVSTTVGSYTVGASDLSSVLITGGTAALTVTPATTITVRKNVASRAAAADQFTLSLRNGTTLLASATTTGTATGLQSAQISQYIVRPSTTYSIQESLTTGAGITYASSYECVRGTTVIAAGASTAGSLTTPADEGADIVCTFTNTPQTARLACDASHFYSVNATGSLQQADIVSGATATVGTWTGVTSANALGVTAGGSAAYALERSADSTDVTSILKWTAAGGFTTLASSSYLTVAGGTEVAGSIVAGAVDLSSSKYYFGKFNAGSFYLWSYTESNPSATRFAYIGSFATGTGPNGNGDLAFDARGNLYVIGAATSGTASTAAIYTVTAATLAAASGGTLTVSASTTKTLTGTDASPAFGNVNGIAFSPRGTAYLASTTGAYEFDPTTWTRVANTASVTVSGSTDLGGCTSPATITLLKNVLGRAATADQFQLTVANGATTVATTATTGTATGRQAQQIGPVLAPSGTTLTVSEAMASGSTSAIGTYTIVNECYADGVRLSNGTTTSNTVTVPDRLGVDVVCTFFNSPRPPATVILSKLSRDPVTGATTAVTGWTVGATATATAGTVAVTPNESPTQVTDAAGRATWSLLFGSAASTASVTVSETLQTGTAFVGATCTVNGTTVTPAFTTAGTVVSATITGVQSAAAVACTFTNRPTATLTLVKVVGLGSAAPTAWTLAATGPGTSLPGPSGRSGSAGATSIPVTPGAAYRLTETGGPLEYVQSGAWQCRTNDGTVVTVSAAGDVTPPARAAVTCTVTNTTATITLLKQVESPRAGFQPETWTVVATPAVYSGGTLPTVSRLGAAYVAGGNAASTFDALPGHTYTLTERLTTPGTRLAYRELRLERLDGATWTTVTSATITAPAAGQSVIYRFVNAPVTPAVLPLTGGTSADVFRIGGALVLVAALTAGLVTGARRRRRAALLGPFTPLALAATPPRTTRSTSAPPPKSQES